MRACRHCSHQNADHLSYCSQCGRRLGPITGDLKGAAASAARVSATGAVTTGAIATGRTVRVSPLLTTATGKTVMATVQPGAAVRTPPARPPVGGFLSWVSGSIAYIYVYLRGKLDAGERRRRLVEERDGAERLLSGATMELGTTILREGIQGSDLTGLLEAIGRAEARREAAVADIVASERLQGGEDARLAAQEAALEAELTACETAHREAEEMVRTVTTESQRALVRLGRIQEDLERLMRSALMDSSSAGDDGQGPRLRHETAALTGEQAGLKEQTQRLERQLGELRERSASLRVAASSARSKRDSAVATRRQASSAMGASIAGHSRERADAEREVGNLTEQLGRAAAQVRPGVSLLQPLFARIDRLEETVADRNSEIAALDQAMGHFDERKLLTGVGLVTSMIAVTVAVIWVALR